MSRAYRKPLAEEAFDEAMFWIKYRGDGFKDIEKVPPALGRAPHPEPYAFTHMSSVSDPDEGATSFGYRKTSKGRE